MNNTRIEKKFVLGKSKEDYLESILIRSGFNRIFKPRYINSIYLDTVNYDFAKDTYNHLNEKNDDVFLLTQTCNHGISSGIIDQMKSIKDRFILDKDKKCCL